MILLATQLTEDLIARRMRRVGGISFAVVKKIKGMMIDAIANSCF